MSLPTALLPECLPRHGTEVSTPRIREEGPVTSELVRRGAFAGHPFVLADVGASGGIGQHWRQFEPALKAFGFDPLIRECERLNAAEKNKSITYHDYFVGFDDYSSLFPADSRNGWSNQPFERTSASRAQRQQSMSQAQWFNNQNPDVVLTQRRTSLDKFFADFLDVKVDFIKIDTDGHDYEVLCGAERVLDRHGVLGLFVESQFHGVSHPHSNLFSNIDRFLRERGFSLFDLEIYRYTRSVLPGHFVYNIPAQTREGQVLAGDALYLCDLAAPGYEDRWGMLASEKLLKLACLFEIFGLPDCAAELIVMKRPEMAQWMNVDEVLDGLARQIHPARANFAELDRLFASSVKTFYPHAAKERIAQSLPRPIRRVLSSIKRRLQI